MRGKNSNATYSVIVMWLALRNEKETFCDILIGNRWERRLIIMFHPRRPYSSAFSLPLVFSSIKVSVSDNFGAISPRANPIVELKSRPVINWNEKHSAS